MTHHTDDDDDDNNNVGVSDVMMASAQLQARQIFSAPVLSSVITDITDNKLARDSAPEGQLLIIYLWLRLLRPSAIACRCGYTPNLIPKLLNTC